MKHTHILQLILVSSLITIAGCFPSQKFEDLPPNIEERSKNLDEVKEKLDSLKTADANKAIELAHHSDFRVRRAVALRLMQVGISSPDTPSVLERLAKDKAPRVRSAAVRALGALNKSNGAGAVIAGLCDKDQNVRLYSQKALIRLGNNANMAILNHLGSSKAAKERCAIKPKKRYLVRHEAKRLLKEMGTLAIPTLADGLTHSDTLVVKNCLSLLADHREAAAKALPEIANVLKEKDESVRTMAIDTMLKIGDRHPVVMPTLYKYQTDSSQKIAISAQNALRTLQARAASSK